jgi:mannose-1-phosphate guanylyltransferase/phosphomannomutase
VEKVVAGSTLEVVRTRASLADLTAVAAGPGVVFGAAGGGGYVFPEFLPAYDAVASLCKLLELLAPIERPLSQLIDGLPTSTLIHRVLPCPWSQKGLVMRLLTERLKGRETDHMDGIKLIEKDGWATVLADPDEPLVHIYAEGDTEEDSERLEAEMHTMIDEIMGGDPSGEPLAAQVSS